MASGQTKNYHLNQWEADDSVLRTDFNADNQKLEAALTAKAEQSEVNDLRQAIDRKGNCRIVSGSYVGTGLAGSANPCTLTFDFVPLVVFLDVRDGDDFNSIPIHHILFQGCTTLRAPSISADNTVSWSGNQVSWRYENSRETASDQAMHQYNTKGRTYHYIALG